jgi:transposase
MRAEVWVGPERRRRWTVEEKRRIVREAFAPEARVADVARRCDVSRSQIYQWRSELAGGRPGTEIIGFVPVEMAGDDTTAAAFEPAAPRGASDPVIEIGLAGGRSLKVPSSLPVAELRRLIRAIEGA